MSALTEKYRIILGQDREVGHHPDVADILDQGHDRVIVGEGQGHVQVHIPGHDLDLATEGRYVVVLLMARQGKVQPVNTQLL